MNLLERGSNILWLRRSNIPKKSLKKKKNAGSFVARQDVCFLPQSPSGMLRNLHKVCYSRNSKVSLLTWDIFQDVSSMIQWGCKNVLTMVGNLVIHNCSWTKAKCENRHERPRQHGGTHLCCLVLFPHVCHFCTTYFHSENIPSPRRTGIVGFQFIKA